MKKLIIAAMMIATSAIVSAGTVNWTLTGATKSNGTTANNLTAYLFGYTADTENPITAANVISLIQAAYTDGFAEKTGAAAVQAFLDQGFAQTPSTAGNYSRGTAAKIDAADAGLVTGKNNVFFVFVDSDPITGDTKVAVSKELTDQSIPGSGNKQFTFGSQATYTAANMWASVAGTPEPTSAMLLLLGVAGLALKRRRA